MMNILHRRQSSPHPTKSETAGTGDSTTHHSAFRSPYRWRSALFVAENPWRDFAGGVHTESSAAHLNGKVRCSPQTMANAGCVSPLTTNIGRSGHHIPIQEERAIILTDRENESDSIV